MSMEAIDAVREAERKAAELIEKARREAALARMTPAPSLARPAQEPAREQKED